MAKLLDQIKSIFVERRKVHANVCIDRRRVTMKEADAQLHDSIDRLDRTVRMKRSDIFKECK